MPPINDALFCCIHLQRLNISASICCGRSRINVLKPLADLSRLSRFQIEWLKRANIPFQATRHLINPYNEHRRVQTSRDGQEVQPQVGAALCRLWDRPETRAPPPAAGPTQLSYGLEQPDEAPLGPQGLHQPPPGPQGQAGGPGQPGGVAGPPPPPPQGFAGRPIRGKTYPPPAQQARGSYRGQGFRQ